MTRPLIIVAVLCFVVFLLPGAGKNLASVHDGDVPPGLHEAYDPSLYIQLRDVKSLVGYIDQTYHGKKNTFEFANYIGTVVSKRFYHGYSYYSMNDNWIAALAGRMVWNDLSAIVVPDDIMKQPEAACSQQSIILMQCARHFGFDVRKVGYDHHFATEVKVGNKWHYIDPNLEVIPETESLDELIRNHSLYSLYKQKLGKETDSILAHPFTSAPNENVAAKAMIFQEATSLLSEYFICFVFFIEAMLFFYYVRRERELI
jgi:hypothetical protein